ncbi:MAG: phosphopantetheine adenylyltransferase [Leptospira sp.]|nr:MAG: phosphopantetheine adenylyltransferase [Leptospira sp.]
MKLIISISLMIVAIIHILPLFGAQGNNALNKMYGLVIEESNLSILMRHRAILFGIVAMILIYAIFFPMYRPIAILIGFVSVISFLILAWSVGGINDPLKRVVIADLIALISLIIATSAYLMQIYQDQR